jgi:NAD(P)-dependent dehydrogenase (short-subunit alcohol dehydrogenase family)
VRRGARRTHSTPRILVLGAQGVLGSFVARRLVEDGYDVVRAGRRPFRDGHGLVFDLDDRRAVAAACADSDLVVSCAHHTGFSAERAVLANGGLLISVANLPGADAQRLATLAAEPPGGPRGLVVAHAGLTPGVTTLMAADLLEQHPQADTIELVVTLSLAQSSGRQGVGDFALPLFTRRGRHRVRRLPLPDPYGERACVELATEADGMFGSVADGRRGRFHYCFRERWLNGLVTLASRAGAMSLTPRRVFMLGRRVPRELSREPHRSWVRVSRADEPLASHAICGEGDYRLSVASTVAFIDALFARYPDDSGFPGVVSADELFTIDDIAPRLEALGAWFEPDIGATRRLSACCRAVPAH